MSSRALRRAQKSKEIEEEALSSSDNEIIEVDPRNKGLFQQVTTFLFLFFR